MLKGDFKKYSRVFAYKKNIWGIPKLAFKFLVIGSIEILKIIYDSPYRQVKAFSGNMQEFYCTFYLNLFFIIQIFVFESASAN